MKKKWLVVGVLGVGMMVGSVFGGDHQVDQYNFDGYGYLTMDSSREGDMYRIHPFYVMPCPKGGVRYKEIVELPVSRTAKITHFIPEGKKWIFAKGCVVPYFGALPSDIEEGK